MLLKAGFKEFSVSPDTWKAFACSFNPPGFSLLCAGVQSCVTLILAQTSDRDQAAGTHLLGLDLGPSLSAFWKCMVKDTLRH